MPAEVPDRSLELDRRRRAYFREQHVDVARFERRETRNSRLRCAGKLPRVKLNWRIRVHRLQMEMMKAWRCKSIRLSLSLGSTVANPIQTMAATSRVLAVTRLSSNPEIESMSVPADAGATGQGPPLRRPAARPPLKSREGTRACPCRADCSNIGHQATRSSRGRRLCLLK